MTTEKSTGTESPSHSGSRPVLLSIFCLFGFVYFLLLSVILLLALFYSGWISEVTNKYAPVKEVTSNQLLLIFLAGALLHLVAFAGLVMIWNLKKAGYYLLGIPSLLIGTYFLLLPGVSITAVIVYVLFIFVFGVYFRRLN
jgi:hypothetical protein